MRALAVAYGTVGSMELQQLRYFLAVVDQGGVTSAAAYLGVAGPTVSTAVRALERDLGTPLFERIGRGMLPTSAGQALVVPARRTLRGVSAAVDAVHEEGELRGSLEIHTLAALDIGVLPPSSRSTTAGSPGSQSTSASSPTRAGPARCSAAVGASWC